MSRVTIKSYPKINLTLDVMGKDQKADKHFINTFLYRVEGSLFDELILTRRKDDQNFVHCDYPGVSRGNHNTVIRALELLNEKGWDVTIKKNIPVGAGLAGGSSNAGVVLKHFAQIKQVPVYNMMDLASEIGADVPFFLLNDNLAYAEGFGDQILQSWIIPNLPIEIIHTGIHVSTPEAYSNLDVSQCARNSVKTEALLKKLQSSSSISSDELRPYIHNDFETSFFRKYSSLDGKGYLCGSGGMMWSLANGQ